MHTTLRLPKSFVASLTMLLMYSCTTGASAPLELRDADGKVRIRMGVGSDGNPSLVLLRNNGAVALTVATAASGNPEVRLSGAGDVASLRFAIRQDNSFAGGETPLLGLYIADQPRLAVALIGGEPQLHLYDTHAHKRISMELVKDQPRVRLHDATGKTRLGLSLDAVLGPTGRLASELSMINMLRHDGMPSLTLSDEDGQPKVCIWDPHMPVAEVVDPAWARLSFCVNALGDSSALWYDRAGKLLQTLGKP